MELYHRLTVESTGRTKGRMAIDSVSVGAWDLRPFLLPDRFPARSWINQFRCHAFFSRVLSISDRGNHGIVQIVHEVEIPMTTKIQGRGPVQFV